MKKIIISLLIGIMLGYWLQHNFIDFDMGGLGTACESNSWLRFDTLCVWGRNPFGHGAWTLWFSYSLPIKF